MNDSDRRTVGVAIILFGLVLIGICGLLDTAPYNPSFPAQLPLGIELGVSGSVVAVLAFAVISRVGSSVSQIATQASAAILGGVCFALGVGYQVSSTVAGGQLLLDVQLTFTGLGFGTVAFVSALAMRGDAITAMSPDAPVPGGSAFCPYCGERISMEHQFCRKCGRTVAR